MFTPERITNHNLTPSTQTEGTKMGANYNTNSSDSLATNHVYPD
jgi:hypothetical protein